MAKFTARNGCVYYDNELEAHHAAEEQSKNSACGIFVEEDHNGFYLTSLGKPGNSCYMCGMHESEFYDDY